MFEQVGSTSAPLMMKIKTRFALPATLSLLEAAVERLFAAAKGAGCFAGVPSSRVKFARQQGRFAFGGRAAAGVLDSWEIVRLMLPLHPKTGAT